VPKALAAAVLVLLALAGPAAAPAWDVTAGFLAGPRTAGDETVNRIYGSGTVYCPFAAVGLWRGFRVGALYEGGYSRTGVIGLYDEPTSLKVNGVEVFAGYWLKFDLVALYLKGGWGNYSYVQTVQSPAARIYPVDARGQAVVAAVGLNVYLLERLYLCGEVKYVPLKVKPYETEVDLSGWRYLVGIGYTVHF
jgi:hypothetical protein